MRSEQGTAPKPNTNLQHESNESRKDHMRSKVEEGEARTDQIKMSSPEADWQWNQEDSKADKSP